MSKPATLVPAPEWIGVRDAESVTGVSRRQLNRLVDAGRLKKQKDGNGVWLYSKADCHRIADANADIPQGGEAELLQAAYNAVRMLLEPARLYNDLIRQEHAALRARCSELEARHSELITTREALLDQSQIRDLVVSGERSKQKLKSQILEGLLTKGLAAIGVDAPKGTALSQLASTLTQEQIDILKSPDFDLLTPEQKESLTVEGTTVSESKGKNGSDTEST